MRDIVCVNRASAPLPDWTNLLVAGQTYADLVAAAGWPQVKLVDGGAAMPPAGVEKIVVWDRTDQPDALAYHDDEGGAPTGHVFRATAQQNGVPLSVPFGHELAEQAGDPTINLLAVSGKGNLVAYENVDAVEDPGLGFKIGDYLFPDFVYPCYFDPSNARGPYDYGRHVNEPFEVLGGGYLSLFDWHVGRWTTLHASAKAEAAWHATQHPYTRPHRRHGRLSGLALVA